MPLPLGPFQKLPEKWIAFREFLVLYKEVRRELRFCRRRARKLNRSIVRLEARIPFYIQMLSAAEGQADRGANQARQKLEGELEQLLATLEGQRHELDLLQKTTSYEANRVELSLLHNLYPQRIRILQVTIVLCSICSVAVFVGVGSQLVKGNGEVHSPRKDEGPSKARASLALRPGPKPSGAPVLSRTPSPSSPASHPSSPPASSPSKPSFRPSHHPTPPARKKHPSSKDRHPSEPVVRWHLLQESIRTHAVELSALLESCKDPDPRIRGLAASTLGEMDAPEAKETLRSLRSDPEPYVRLIAEEALRGGKERSVAKP